jgi:hypothetical protein
LRLGLESLGDAHVHRRRLCVTLCHDVPTVARTAKQAVLTLVVRRGVVLSRSFYSASRCRRSCGVSRRGGGAARARGAGCSKPVPRQPSVPVLPKSPAMRSRVACKTEQAIAPDFTAFGEAVLLADEPASRSRLGIGNGVKSGASATVGGRLLGLCSAVIRRTSLFQGGHTMYAHPVFAPINVFAAVSPGSRAPRTGRRD